MSRGGKASPSQIPVTGPPLDFLQSVIDGLPDPLLVVDTEYRVVLANRRAQEAGPGDPVTSGLRCYEFTHRLTQPCEESHGPCPLREAVATRQSTRAVHVHPTADGGERFFQVTASPIFNAGGEVEWVIETSLDITDHLANSVALAESQMRFRTLFERAIDGIIVMDLETRRIVMANPMVARLMGYRHGRLLELSMPDLFPGCVSDGDMGALADLCAGETSTMSEVAFTCPDGKVVYFDVTSFPIVVDGRRCVAATFHDATVRRAALRDLRQSEEKLRHVFQQLGDGIMMVDETGRVIEWNAALERITDLGRDEALGCFLHEVHRKLLLDPRHDEQYFSRLQANLDHFFETRISPNLGRPVEVEIQRRDGARRFLELVVFGIDAGTSWLAAATVRDVTFRKEIESEKNILIADLENALESVKTLHGLLPICSNCKKIRDDQGYWSRVETYLERHTDVMFTHSICPPCAKLLYDIDEDSDDDA